MGKTHSKRVFREDHFVRIFEKLENINYSRKQDFRKVRNSKKVIKLQKHKK
jgi:hypothetical protein